MKKILGICGDSFAAADSIDNLSGSHGKHFSEVLGRMLGWDVVTYARGAVSNNCIRLQMEEIIKHNPTHVIVCTTSVNRFEFPIEDLSVDDFNDKWSNALYDPINGIFNIKYEGFECESVAQHENFQKIKPTLHSHNLNSLLSALSDNQIMIHDKFKTKLSKEMSQAISYYFQFIYDMKWKQQLDTWIISDGVHRFLNLGIDFHITTTQLLGDYFTHIGDRAIPNHHPLNPWTYYDSDAKCKNNFHISYDDSDRLAELWYDKLKSYNI